MPDLSSIAASTLASYYEEVRAKVHTWVAPISTDQLWTRPYPYGNSIGHLLLHITGNLSYYIGTRIAGTGYVRDRDREFNETARKPKDEVLADFDRAIALVVSTIGAQSPQDWCAPYSAEREPEARDRFTVFFRMAAHAYHHVGQMIYLSKELTRSRP
ncbi:MAG: DinB family protein [Spirochaetia bacterium]|nr:DinB family protein [Spirochaetia bacterium]